MKSTEYKRTSKGKCFEGWWKHLRPYGKRKAHKKGRQIARKEIEG